MAVRPKTIVEHFAGEFPTVAPALPHLKELNELLARDRPYVRHIARWEDVGRALIHAARLLWGESVREPLRPASPAHTRQIMVLAIVLDRLLHQEKTKKPKSGSAQYHDVARRRLAQWFWCATFANYGPKTTGALYDEAMSVLAWVASRDSEPPAVVRRATPPSMDEVRAIRHGRGAWRYNAVLALLAREDPRDLLTGERLEVEERFKTRIQGHHLFPIAWANQQGDSVLERIHGIANIAPLTAYTNVWIGKRAPEDYLGRIEALGTPRKRIEELLRSHHIEPGLFRSERFFDFYEHRLTAIHRLVSSALTGASAS